MSAPNLLSPTTVTGKSAGQACTNSATAIIAAMATGHSATVRSLYVSNIAGTGAPTITVDIYKNQATAYRVGYTMIVPAGSPIVLITLESQITLEENDSLRLTASASSVIEAFASWDDIS